MFDKLKSLLTRKPAGAPAVSGLALALADYPPYLLPHPGYGKDVSIAQAHENLEWFLAHRDERLALVSALVQQRAGIDTAPALADSLVHGANLADALNDWAAREWPAVARPEWGATRWASLPRDRDHIALSMALDVAILLGEVIRRGNPDWRWGLDLSKVNLKDGMLSTRRVMLLADPVGQHTEPFLLDLEDQMVSRIWQPKLYDYQLPGHPWRRVVEQSLRGDHMQAYREQAKQYPIRP
ncbi:hypothetical protein [Ottowia testudinis]|uniref:hypothetical protein n=1 Tax=Ottowia testudinis TaxID=2816950 RepID=UPI001FB15BC0|nr:hypothetical protein [Ottowia testudinis]